MKKFLTVLLVIAVMFTFSFSSAFADTSSATLTDKEKDVLNIAYSNLTVSAYTVNYDDKYHNRTSEYYTNLPDLTEFSISAANMQKAVDKAYTEAVKTGVLPGGDLDLTNYDVNDANRAGSVAVATVKAALLSAAQTTYFAEAEKAAFDEYKTAMKSLVNSIDLSSYTTTKQDTPYTAADNEKYDTAAKAAAADVAYLLAVIDKAEFEASAADTANANAAWKTTYEGLYAALFGADKVAKVKENKDDVLDANLVTSISYALTANYATTKSEAAEDANKAADKATKVAQLTQAVTTYVNSDDYSSKQQAGIDAYVEAMKYLIENEGTLPASFAITAVVKATDGDYTVNGIDYVDRCATAAKVKANQETAKSNAAILGYFYDETEAAKALKARLNQVYAGTSVETAAPYVGDGTLTAGTKAAAKIDLSDVKEQGDIAKYYRFDRNKKDYYAKEWDEVKAAVDTYNAAVDAATTQKDLTDAATALDKAIAKIKDKRNVSVNASTTITQLRQYFNLTKSTYNTTNDNSEKIYINWGKGWEDGVVNATVNEWFIAQGARSAKEAAALYSEATKVIDNYKAYSAAKSEAEAVKAQIAALPTNPTVADKAAVTAAYDAYQELPADTQIFVTNVATLKKAINSVHTLERNSLVTDINALPAVSKVTVDNKKAVKAAIDAYETYTDTDAYMDNTFTGITPYTWANIEAYKKAVKAADLEEIEDLYNSLAVKYSVDALTKADAEAVAKLQAAIAAYIAEYNESPDVNIEKTAEKMAAVISALNKSAVTSLKIKASSKAKKGSMTISWRVIDGDKTAAEGYQVARSTKLKSGFKTMIKTAKMSYKNTKGLKKGTRYYYKVRAYKVVDGKKVYSDWSNKAYRVAK